MVLLPVDDRSVRTARFALDLECLALPFKGCFANLKRAFVSDGPLQSTKRELQRRLSEPKLWAALIGGGLIIGLIGPFGTFDSLAMLPRLAYWIAVAVLTYVTGLATVYLVVAVFFEPRSTRLVAYLVAGMIAGLPPAAIVVGLNSQLYGHPASIGDALVLTAYSVAIATIVSVLVALFSIPGAATPDAATTAAAALAGPVAAPPQELRRPSILDRLPLHLRGRLAYMTMQDHYVDVHTDKGSTLVLMRLADAITETDGVPGLQIHRSHWVARAAVQAAVRRDGKLLLKMEDGAELPVSRSYMGAVREAGLAR
jgi:DNA-binding LytR/AlgR family response regulator